MGKRLGKGLNALLSDLDLNKEIVERIPINELRTNPYQPRKIFDADAIEELKISIIEYGIIQPLIVRQSIKGYEIVAGERRFRAAKEAGLTDVPAIIKTLDDHKMMEIALLENLQREDLSVIEEAEAYKSLIEELNITQEALSEKVGKSRSHIANMMRLLTLPDDVIIQISNKQLSMGHARALLGLNDKSILQEVVNKIISGHLNVRQTENLITQLNNKRKQKPKKQLKDIYVIEQESKLREVLGTSVKIQKNKKKGKIEIEFYDDADLERLIKLLNH